MNALAGLMNPAAIGQSFQMGMEQGRARRGEMETQNALTMLAKDPNSSEGFEKLSFYQPQAAMQIRQQRDASAAKQQESQLVQAAMGGNPQAMQQLATVNFDKWKTLDTSTRAKATEESKVLGNAALDLLNTPPDQRGAKLQGYVQAMSQQFPEVAQIAALPPPQLEAALRSAVFEAQMVDKLIAMERPRFMAIPEGGTLVNTRDAAAVQQFGGQAPAQGGQGGNVLSMQDLQRVAQSMPNADAMMQWMRSNGITVSVQTPQEAMNLPSGTAILLPDGTIGSVP